MPQQNNNQNFLKPAAQSLYGDQRKKEEEEKSLRNSLLNELGDNLTPAQTLYSSNEELMKMRDEIKGTPTGYGVPATNKDPNMTPIRDLKSRQNYLKQGICRPNEKDIPGVNACSSNVELKFDNRQLKPETYAKLRKFLGLKEDCKTEAYQDDGGVWTIGYGHTRNVKPGDKITKEQAEKLFEEDMKAHLDSLKHVKVKLNENQKGSLGSLIYNTGGTKFYHSDMLKKLNAKDFKGAADEFDLIIHDNKGKVEPGLITRRKEEKEWFLTPDEY